MYTLKGLIRWLKLFRRCTVLYEIFLAVVGRGLLYRQVVSSDPSVGPLDTSSTNLNCPAESPVMVVDRLQKMLMIAGSGFCCCEGLLCRRETRIPDRVPIRSPQMDVVATGDTSYFAFRIIIQTLEMCMAGPYG